jgi:rSAM/selenodomain-associated transferase 2
MASAQPTPVLPIGGGAAGLTSVIIPALNEAENIAICLAAARRDYARAEVELIVVDGGSTDGTQDLVPPDVTLVHAPRGRATQMNRGAAASRGEVLVFCHADSQLPPGWRDAVIRALSEPAVSGGAFELRLWPERGVLRWINRMRVPPDWRLVFGDAAQFMRRDDFERVGGFPEIPLMEDVEMARALHRAGRLVRLPLRITTSSRRFLERGPLRQWLSSGWCLFRYLYLGVSPEQIAATYRSSREEAL